MPLPLPLTVSSMASAVSSILEVPTMQKSCVAVPSVGTITLTVTGELDEQLRSAAAAVAA